MKNGKNILKDGTIKYYKGNKLHREDGPAVIFFNGYQNKIQHVGDWYLNGKLHRDGGPAQTRYSPDFSVKIEYWYQNGLLHRDDGGPTFLKTYIEKNDDYAKYNNIISEKYHKFDKLHRVDGPAEIEYYIGFLTNENIGLEYEGYYLEGIRYSKNEYNNALRPYKLKKLLNK